MVATQGEAKKHIQNVALFAGKPLSPMEPGKNKYTGKQFEYFEGPTSAYVMENAKYASNYYQAHVQGVIPGTFETERGAYIRTSDVVEQTTGNKLPNDYQTVYFQDTRIRGLYTGAKVKYAGNTWLAISPFNVADPLSCAVIRRCNAAWKHLDYYGNVLVEPFVFQDARAQSTANEYLDWSVIPNWYQKCVMQRNEDTKELAYNRRIVLGSAVAEVRGLVDFITDFSGDTLEETQNPEPTHVFFFDVQFQQPTEIDDMENGIAGGKAFSWQILPSYSGEMSVNATQTLEVNSLRNNEPPDTAKHPVSYLFSSSDTSVLNVDMDGMVTAVGEGEGEITITLAQNTNITATVKIAVTSEAIAPQFVFTPELPDRLKQMQTYSGQVEVQQGGQTVEAQITIETFGATDNADVVFAAETGVLTVVNYRPSNTPLSLVFKDLTHGIVFTKQIQLEGY